jgi:hypothetical protein
MKVWNGTTIRPALIVIGLMVLINAGIFFYFDGKSDAADEKLQNQVTQNEKLAKANRTLLAKQDRERQIRTDQNCEFAELTHLRDVQSLEGTYQYLERAESRPNEKGTLLYELVLQGAPKTIASGEIDLAPDYCDDPGYGLQEPDPVVPKRPEFLPPEINRAATTLKTKGINLDEQPIQSTLKNPLDK